MNANAVPGLHNRLRRPPVAGTVPGSLPVLFFGDLPRARVATIGLNPSWQEYLSPERTELDGPRRRFHTLRSLGASDRASLTAKQMDDAVETMRAYFEPTKPAYSWFRSLARVLEGFGASYTDGSAAHLDLVQEATDPAWSGFRQADRVAADALIHQDLDFLRWQIGAFELQALICTSKTVMDSVCRLANARVVSRGDLARIRWSVALASVSGRSMGIVGWNIPLARPTGLDASGQVRLGALLRARLDADVAA